MPMRARKQRKLPAFRYLMIDSIDIPSAPPDFVRPPDTDTTDMAFVRKVAAAVPDILYVYDVQDKCNVYCNREIATVLGYSPDEIRGFGTHLFSRLVHPEDIDAIWEGQRRLVAANDGEVVEVYYRMCHRDGAWRWLHSRDTVFNRDGDGRVIQMLGVAHEVTSERRSREELTEAVDRYRALVSVLSDWVWEVDSGVYTYVSPQVLDILGYTPAELLGRCPFDLIPAAEIQRVEDALRVATEARAAFQGLRHIVFAKDGRPIQIETSGTPVFHAETGECVGYRGVSRDITSQSLLEIERETLLAQTRRRADQDPLTGLLNRAAFERALNHHLVQARNGTEDCAAEQPVAVLLFDLDNLKFFNDTYGHGAGDEVLLFIANTLSACCLADEIIGRIGGDEFAIILPTVDPVSIDARLTSLKASISRTGYLPPKRAGNLADPIPIPIVLSGGVAVAPYDGVTAAALFNAADERLYKDKTNSEVTWSETLKASLSEDLVGFAIVDALVAAVAAKDRYTLRHSEDVFIYAALIGEELGLSPGDLEALKVAALLHDAGKIGVPDRLLRLPGPLSPDEFEAVKLHAVLGAALVESAAPEIVRKMPSVVPAIRHHHERWDGAEGGYPERLAGEAIPVHARILAVADAFSSMTTDRPYRRGAASTEAIARLREGAGSQWHHDCVVALISALKSAS